jgi:hypothetical protein
MCDLARNHPLFEAGIQELIGIYIKGSHRPIISSQNNEIEALIIHKLTVCYGSEVGLLELWGHIIDFESLKLGISDLKLVDIE